MLVAEVIGGILTGSLALLASWLAGRVATLEPTPGACPLDTLEGPDACLAQPTVPAHHHAH